MRTPGYDNNSPDFRQGELKMYIQFKSFMLLKKDIISLANSLDHYVINTYSRDMWPGPCHLPWWPVTLACCLGNLSVLVTPRPLPACSIWSASGTTLPCVMLSGPCNIMFQVSIIIEPFFCFLILNRLWKDSLYVAISDYCFRNFSIPIKGVLIVNISVLV